MAPTTNHKPCAQHRDIWWAAPPPPFKERIPDAPHTLKTEKCLGGGWAVGGSEVGTVGQARGVPG